MPLLKDPRTQLASRITELENMPRQNLVAFAESLGLHHAEWLVFEEQDDPSNVARETQDIALMVAEKEYELKAKNLI